ncbi:MAG: nicotinate phosphoribosyltransferase [Prochloraceae cyanobacterium]|nr:nicotinate phosphoribosyltransferase [Prochloraceae cyanobacterium]
MAIFRWLRRIFEPIGEGILRIFSPVRDDYPKSGVKPFHGEPYENDKTA